MRHFYLKHTNEYINLKKDSYSYYKQYLHKCRTILKFAISVTAKFK